MQTNLRLTDRARARLKRLADSLGISQARLIERLLRDEARRRGLEPPAPASAAPAAPGATSGTLPSARS